MYDGDICILLYTLCTYIGIDFNKINTYICVDISCRYYIIIIIIYSHVDFVDCRCMQLKYIHQNVYALSTCMHLKINTYLVYNYTGSTTTDIFTYIT